MWGNCLPVIDPSGDDRAALGAWDRRAARWLEPLRVLSPYPPSLTELEAQELGPTPASVGEVLEVTMAAGSVGTTAVATPG